MFLRMNVYALYCICLGYWLEFGCNELPSRAVWSVVGWEVPLCPTTDPVFMFRLKKPPKEKEKKKAQRKQLTFLYYCSEKEKKNLLNGCTAKANTPNIFRDVVMGGWVSFKQAK